MMRFIRKKKSEEIPFVIETLRNLEKSIEKKLGELEAISDKD